MPFFMAFTGMEISKLPGTYKAVADNGLNMLF
jgi:hypothetical protein